MRKVGLYLRVSTQEQAERGWSIEGQYTELRKFCEAHEDWKVVRILKDPGFTAANLERPEIQQLLQLAQAGELEVVVVWRYDRLSRDNFDFPLILGLFRKHGVHVVSATEPSEGTDDPTGEFVVHMIGRLATMERKQIALRVKMGMRTRTRNGLWQGGTAPYSYAYDGIVGKLVPDPVEAAVKRIFESHGHAGRLPRGKEELRGLGSFPGADHPSIGPLIRLTLAAAVGFLVVAIVAGFAGDLRSREGSTTGKRRARVP